MTQSPYGGTASQSMQSNAGASTDSGTSTDHNRAGNGAGSGGAAGNAHLSAGQGADFGATTISGSSRQGTAQGEGRTHTSQTGSQARPSNPPQASGRGARNRGPRRARLQLRHISPLTVLKFSCVLAIALFFVWLIVVGVLYGVLDAAGVIQNINDTVVQLNGSGSKPPITAGIVFGGAAIVGVVNIVLFVALTTIGSVIYNLCADLVGGIEITLSER
jgi:hypothetical protein